MRQSLGRPLSREEEDFVNGLTDIMPPIVRR
jgi:hypothetical protein